MNKVKIRSFDPQRRADRYQRRSRNDRQKRTIVYTTDNKRKKKRKCMSFGPYIPFDTEMFLKDTKLMLVNTGFELTILKPTLTFFTKIDFCLTFASMKLSERVLPD
jgi:hypothetical protein